MVAAAMILGDPQTAHVQEGEPATLDDLFRQAAARRPDAIALCDPPNRLSFTDGEPRRLTYSQADHIVSAIAGRLRRLGLATDSIVALQLPNTAESVLALLGVLRAGLIAAPLPLLWRRIDAAAALKRVGARAIMSSAQIGATDHCSLVRDIAAEVFPIRYVCSFGKNLPDGVIPLDDLMAAAPLLDPPIPTGRDGNPAAQAAVVTFEITAEGLMPVARNHIELIAEDRRCAWRPNWRITQRSSRRARTARSRWLLSGGTLSLHQPFDATTFAEQCRHDRCNTVVVPGPLVTRIAQAGLLTHEELKTILALWRAPERLMAGSAWRHSQAALVDVQPFGETALIAARRGPAGEPAEIPLGHVSTPCDASDARSMLETADRGTLAARGPMVPKQPLPARRGTRGDALLHAGRRRVCRHRLSVSCRPRQR
jgi:hypothetical protein